MSPPPQRSTHLRSRLASLVCCLTILATAIALFNAVLTGERTLYFGDLALYFIPMLAFQKSELLQGRIPLWNPRILCGTPFVGNPQAWPLYPSSLLLYWFRPERVAALDGVLHLVWAALGTFVFLRQRRLDRLPSLFGALSWGFGGALVSKMQFPNMVQAASYLPWLLWAVDRLVDGRGARRVGVLGLLLGLALLAAHPQMFLMQFYLSVAWMLWRLSARSWSERRRAVTGAACALVIGIAMASGQLLPVVQTVRTSVRTELTLPKANRFILPPYEALYNFVAPNFYGNPATDTEYIGRGNFWEPCAYAGCLSFCLAVGTGILGFRNRPEIRFWAIVSLIAVWLALGRESGLFAVVFYVVPGVAKFHDAARWLQPATFALACLASYGLNDVRTRMKSRTSRDLLAILLLAANTFDVGLFVTTLNPTAAPNIFEFATRPLTTRVRAYYADERALWGRYISYRTYDERRPEETAAFVAAHGPNLTNLAGFDLVNGYEPVHSDVIDLVLQKISLERDPANSRLVSDAGAVAVIGLDPSSHRPTLRAVTGSHGRAWIGDTALPVTDGSPDRLRISIPGGIGHGKVIVADAFAPGWTAMAGGKPVPITIANGAFRSVKVSGGASDLTFTYEPCAWRVGAFVTVLASGILCLIWGQRIAQRWVR